jgi:ABC-type antimicrobial peptide transport system permease subunit
MTFTDYVIDILLIAVVFRQMRARELTPGSVLLPVVLVGVACLNYLKAFTPRGNDVLLIALLAAAGVVLGLLSGFVTDVWRATDGRVVARAGLVAAAFWVAGMGFRFAFAVWSTGSGAADVTRFSLEHRISGGQAWTTALVLMAVGEVLARVAVLQLRRPQAQQRPIPTHA